MISSLHLHTPFSPLLTNEIPPCVRHNYPLLLCQAKLQLSSKVLLNGITVPKYHTGVI